MKQSNLTLISVIIPLKNEAESVAALYERMMAVFKRLPKYDYEFIYVDDGSTDTSVEVIDGLESRDDCVRLIRLARNFGKEVAVTAGLHHAKGQAAIIIDADLQHPPEVIPEFLEQWEAGYDVVIGKRKTQVHASFFKRMTSRYFYKLINRISSVEIIPNSTDYRLLDRAVVNEFNRYTERNRMTRGLIDWLGFSRAYVKFIPDKRAYGEATYGYLALMGLAFNAVISLSFFPLRIAGYLGSIITIVSAVLGTLVFVERFALNDPWDLHISGTSILAIILLFLIGIVLVCLGLIALYIANIYGEVANRPLYVEKRRPVQKRRRP